MRDHEERKRKNQTRRQLTLLGILLAVVFLAGIAGLVSRALRGPAGGPAEEEDEYIRRVPLPGEDVVLPDYVAADLLPKNPYSRPGKDLREIVGVVIHYVANPNTSAQGNRNYFASLASGEEGTYASSHFIVGLEGEVLQCVPLTEIAYASNSRNSDTVSVEVCHPDETGLFSDVTYNRVVELTAWLCHTFGLDPEADVIRHHDVTGKLCPLYYVEHPEAWERLRADTAAALEALAAEAEEETG